MDALHAVMAEHPMSTLAEFNAMLKERTGASVSLGTLKSAMRRTGIKRVVPPMPAGYVVSAEVSDARYGYREHITVITGMPGSTARR